MPDKVAQYLIGLGGDPSDLAAAFTTAKGIARSAVDEIKRITDKADLFSSISDNLPKVQQAIDSAKGKITQLTAEIAKIEDAGGKAPKALTQALADAERAVVSATKEMARQQQQLATLDSQLTRAGVNTKALAAEQARLAAASQAAAEAATIQAAKQTLGLTTLKDTEAQALRLKQSYVALQASGTLSAAETAAAQKLLSQQLKELEGTVTKADGAFQHLGDAKEQFRGMVAPALAASAAIGTVVAELAHATEAARSFDNNLALVGTVTQLNKEQLDALGAGARSLARDIGIDVNEALKSLYELIRSGVPPENSLEVLRASAEAAKASITDTATGARAASVLISAFGVDVKSIGPALDIVVRSAQSGGPTLAEFAANAGHLGQAVRASGADFREVAALLNVMTNASNDAAGSTETLTKILINLNRPEIGAKLRDLGIDGRSLADTFRQLDEKGLRLNELLELGVVSTKGAAALAALTNNAGQVPIALNAVATATGTVAAANAKLYDTQRERQERFNAALHETEIQLGKLVGAAGGLLTVGSLLLNLFNSLGTGFEGFNALTAGPIRNILVLADSIITASRAAKDSKAPIAEFHQGLIDGSVIVLKASDSINKLRGDIKFFADDLLKQTEAIRTNAAAQVDAVNKAAENAVAALDKSLKAQVATDAASAEIRKKAEADKLAIIVESEAKVTAATQKAIDARTLLATKDADIQKNLARDVTAIRSAALTKILGDYQTHYGELARLAQESQAKLNALETERVTFNEGIQSKLRDIRLASLSDLQQYSERAQEVDRLIAKGREVAATQGIDAAKKYFDQAVTTSEGVKKIVNDDGVEVVTQFQAQQKQIELIKKVAAAYNDELGKAGQRAKEGADGTEEALKSVGEKIKSLQEQLADLNKQASKAITLEISQDIKGYESAKAAIADLVKPETKVITIQTQLSGNSAPPPGFAGGGYVPRWREYAQAFADGGPVFRRPGWKKVPGTGNADTQPALLSEGDFVMRKSASQKLGDGFMSRLANFYADGGPVMRFADGGTARRELTDNQKQLGYAHYVLQYLFSHPFFNEGRKALGDDIRIIERGYGNASVYKDMTEWAESLASNYQLYRFYGVTSTGTGEPTPPSLKSFDQWVHMIELAKKFAAGGMARGGDTVPAMLTPGEWIVPRQAAMNISKFFGGGFLPSLNAMRDPPRPKYLASGGPVGDIARAAGRHSMTSLAPTFNITINTPFPVDDDRTMRQVKRKLDEINRRSS